MARPGEISLQQHVGGRGQVELDDPRGRQRRERLGAREVALDDERAAGREQLAGDVEERVPGRRAEPSRLLDRPRGQRAEEQLLEVVLGEQRQPERAGEPARERALAGAGRAGDDDEERRLRQDAARRRST
jgi:hypothetical protein